MVSQSTVKRSRMDPAYSYRDSNQEDSGVDGTRTEEKDDKQVPMRVSDVEGTGLVEVGKPRGTTTPVDSMQVDLYVGVRRSVTIL